MKTKKKIDQYDEKETYCRKLGHFIKFNYCRKEKADKKELPCAKILDCWFEKIPVHDFINENYLKNDIAYIFQSSKPKITSILELIEKAKKIEKIKGDIS